MAKLVGFGVPTGSDPVSVAACVAQGGTWVPGCTPTDSAECVPAGQQVPACSGPPPQPTELTEEEKAKVRRDNIKVAFVLAGAAGAGVLGYRYWVRDPTVVGSVGAGLAGFVVAVIIGRAVWDYSWSHWQIEGQTS